MRVREKKTAPAKARGQSVTRKSALVHTFPAPIRGWVLNESLAAVAPGSASILDNWIPTTTGVRTRGGSAKWATLSNSGPVLTLFTYHVGTTEKFFGSTSNSIFDITSVADANVIPSAAVSAQTSGEYSTEQFGTAGGDYLYAVNGDDSPQLYDGTSWTAITGASSPAITGVTTSSLSHVWSYASRLFFVEKNTLSAWYLPVDSIGGAAAEFSLAGIFKKGGALMFGATWSLDAGDGLDDTCVFVSTEGEVAVYSGTNPGAAADWQKQGVYQISRPLGPRAFIQAGGDLLIATESGVVPLSEAISKDVAALTLSAVSSKIEPYWQEKARVLTENWQAVKWSQKNLMVLSQPNTADEVGSALIANLHTGAWARITGWVTRSLGIFQGDGFFGDNSGSVFQMERGGNDNGAPYTCTFLGQHEAMNEPGRQKTVLQMRGTFTASNNFAPKITAQTDFKNTASAPPNSTPNFTNSLWDEGLWDGTIWDRGVVTSTQTQWFAIGRTGHTIAPEVQVTFGTSGLPRVELVQIDAAYDVGALVA